MRKIECDAQQLMFARIRRFLDAARALPCDRVIRLALLFALLEESRTNRGTGGASIAVLADHISVPLEVARHGIRGLRVDGLVLLGGRSLRTEFFTLAPGARQRLLACLAAFENPFPPAQEAMPVDGHAARPVTIAEKRIKQN